MDNFQTETVVTEADAEFLSTFEQKKMRKAKRNV
jgi:hypothetical protein